MSSAPQKKPFKLEMWMLGALILPIGIGIAVWSFLQRDSVDLGGECSDREQCKAPADACLEIGGRSICSVQCSPGCPPGFSCVQMDVTMQNAAGFRDLGGMRYCLPAGLAATPPPAP